MNREQLLKILQVGIVITFFMLFFEIIFEIPQVASALSQWVEKQSGWLVYGVVWLVMFIQVCIVPIPAILALNAFLGAGIVDISQGGVNGVLHMFSQSGTWLFILVSLTASTAGAAVAYLIGKKWGIKAAKWCAGSEADYNKWSKFIVEKGKWPYALTVLLPVFPDDLICIVVGAVKFDFKFFIVVNFLGRAIGLITTLTSLVLIGSGGKNMSAAIVWAIALAIEIILIIILSIKKPKSNPTPH